MTGATTTLLFKEAIEYDPTIETDILASYPIFDPAYRGRLNELIKDRFWNREIGQESVSMFKLALKRKLNEVMPLYNEHYLLSLMQVDPLSTMSIKSITEMDGSTATTGTSNSDSTSLAKSRAVSSETPQTQLNPDQDYATAMQDNISDSAANGTSTENQNVNQDGTTDNTTNGYQGHAPMLILQTRQALVNVDLLVLDELNELFMLIWSNGDSFTTNGHHYGGYPYGYRYF